MKNTISRHAIPWAGLLSLALAFGACSEELQTVVPAEPADLALAADTEALQALGFDVTDLVVLDDAYVVEGDMMISKEQLDSLKNKVATRQSYFGSNYLIDVANQSEIAVYIDPLLDQFFCNGQDWDTFFVGAINAWNAAGSNIKLVQTNMNEDISIYKGDFLGTLATASIPEGGKPGTTIRVDPLHTISGFTDARRKTQAIHLLGHALGFGHTDEVTGYGSYDELQGAYYMVYNIGNTGPYDTNSVMNKNNYTSSAGLSNDDKAALLELYPKQGTGPVTPTIPNFSVSTSKSEYTIGEQITFNLSFSSTPPSGYAITWSYPGLTLVSGQGTTALRVSASSGGSKTVTAFVTLNGAPNKSVQKTVTVVSTLAPGTLTPASQTIVSGSRPNITHSGASGGNGTHTVQWYYKLSTASTWGTYSNLPLTNTGNAAQTYQFKARVTSGSQTAETNVVTVTVPPVVRYTFYLGGPIREAYAQAWISGDYPIVITPWGGQTVSFDVRVNNSSATIQTLTSQFDATINGYGASSWLDLIYLEVIDDSPGNYPIYRYHVEFMGNSDDKTRQVVFDGGGNGRIVCTQDVLP